MAAKTLQPGAVELEKPAAPSTPPHNEASPPPPTLTAEQIAIVKSTAPVLQVHGVTITTLFYKNMIDANPELRNVFSATSQATGAQPRALAASVLAYATYIDDLPKLHHAVERIAHKHASLQIQPAQYAIVGKYLMEAIGAVLGDAATPAIVDAWSTAYAVLASVFIGREQDLYAEARQADHNSGRGWVGWRAFKVAKREPAAEGILSLYLAPVDGRPLPSFLPGQYVSLQLPVPSLGNVLQSRQYSLSQAPRADGDVYRISVKRDGGHAGSTGPDSAPGIVSNLVHKLEEGDQVELSQPQGEFVLDADHPEAQAAHAPVVLVSAGVGATPMLSILDQLASQSPVRPVSWLHGSHSLASLPFAETVKTLQAAHPDTIQTRVFLTEASDAATAAADSNIVTGTHLNVVDVPEGERAGLLHTDNAQTGYYVCGPSSFMLDTRNALEALGVSADRIHLELFATGDL